jgi:hypothetical protein
LVVKLCPRCKQLLPLSEFGVRTNGQPQHWCRACHCAYQREYYARNKEYYFTLEQERLKRIRQMLREAKDRPCADCGRRYPYDVMDFDHRPGEKKRFNLADTNSQAWRSIKNIQAEIAKCDVVCANSHRERTYRRRKQAAKVADVLNP